MSGRCYEMRVGARLCTDCGDPLPADCAFKSCDQCRAARALQKAEKQCRGIYRCIRCEQKGHNVLRCPQKVAI